MKKVIFLLVCAFCLTGCQMDYKLEFKDGKIQETIVGKFDTDIIELAKELEGDSLYIEKELAEEDIYSLKDEEIFYDKQVKVDNNKSEVTLKYEYNYENFQNSYLIDKCFEDYYFVDNKDYYYIDLSGEFTCFHNEDIQIKVISDKQVISHNADKYEDGTYIWNLKLDEDEHDIKFQISKTVKATSQEETIEREFNIFPIIGLIIFAIAFLMIFLLKRRMNKDE